MNHIQKFKTCRLVFAITLLSVSTVFAQKITDFKIQQTVIQIKQELLISFSLMVTPTTGKTVILKYTGVVIYSKWPFPMFSQQFCKAK
jgi:hypothetical protein